MHGVGEYFAGWSGVGQSAEETPFSSQAVVIPKPQERITLDLKDAEAVRQLKMAMSMSPFMLPFLFGEDRDPDFDERFFDDPIWGQLSTKFARLWIEGFKEAFPSIPDPEGMFESPHLNPKSSAVNMVLFTLGYRAPGAPQIVDFNDLKKLTTFFDATGGDSSKGVVIPPFFSREEQEGGAAPVKASTIAAVGLGFLGLVALSMMLGGKKRRR